MRSRNEQDYEQRRQQILDGALEVFASKGFEKATNKDIATHAGIGSPGLIYHYFEDKSDLFRHVVEKNLPALHLVAHPEMMMDKPPREALTLFAQTFLKVLDNPRAVALIKLLLGEVVRRPSLADMINRIGPGRVFPTISRYMAAQMEAGTLRQMDPGAATRCFVGPLIAYMITREVYPQPDSDTLSSDAIVEATVDIFLRGMEIQA